MSETAEAQRRPMTPEEACATVDGWVDEYARLSIENLTDARDVARTLRQALAEARTKIAVLCSMRHHK